MATLKDISRHLGISVTQVSRALNGHADVSKATREKVAEAARELGYSANISARKLKSGRSGIVAMVVPARSEQADTDILMEIVIGLSAEFSRRGMQFVLHVMSEGEDEVETYRRLWNAGTLDGFVLSDPRRDDARIGFLEGQGAPFIVHGRDGASVPYAFVDIDNRAIGETLAGCLLALGHRRIALIDGRGDMPFSIARHAGVEAALAAQGGHLDPALVHQGPMTVEAGATAAERLLAGTPPTGIVAGNLMLARGVMRVLAARGIDVPGDMSLVAHDDVIARYPAEAFDPPIARTRSPLRDAWGPLADGLAAAIAGRPLSEQQILLPVEFVEGASLGPASRS